MVKKVGQRAVFFFKILILISEIVRVFNHSEKIEIEICSTEPEIFIDGLPESYLNGHYEKVSGENLTAIYELTDNSFIYPLVHRLQRRKKFIETPGWTLSTDFGYRVHYRYFAEDVPCLENTQKWYPVEDSVIG